MSQIDRTVEKVRRVLQEGGVETFFVLLRDPDSDGYIMASGGSRFWRVGALHMQLREEEADWLDEAHPET